MFFRRVILAAMTLALSMESAKANEPASLKDLIDAFVTQPRYKESDWGILITDTKTGEIIYSRNSDRLFQPASTTKLYSCSAALKAFGAGHRFHTPVYARGMVSDSILQGDLVLVAQGDLTMGGRDDGTGIMAFANNDHTYAGGSSPCEITSNNPLRGLEDLARQVKAAGINEVQGDVLIDARLFDNARGSGSGPDLLTPIIVNDNVIDILIKPASASGKQAETRLVPQTSAVALDADVQTVAVGQATRIEVRPGGNRGIVVRGQIPVGAKTFLAIYPVSDPAGFSRVLFMECLARAGIRMRASKLQESNSPLPDQEAYTKLHRVAVHTSAPLSEVVKVTLKVSHNLYASTVPLLLAAKEGKKSLKDGLRIQGQLLRELGVETQSISFAGGAGGANADFVTPAATVKLLRAIAEKPEMKAIFDGLPILGVDGTLAESAPKDSPAKGKVFGKTGTLGWQDFMNDRLMLTSKALAGTMTTAKGKKLTFAVFVNKVPLPTGVTSVREGKAIGALCEMIYLHAP